MSTSGFRRQLYDRYFSTLYGRSNPPDAEAYRTAGRALAGVLGRWLPARRDAEILDVACGIGYAVDMLRSAGYTRARGVDLSAEQVEVAKRRGLPIEQGDAFDALRASPGRLDLILALDFLEHLTRDELLEWLALAREALVPGGRLVIKTPNASSLLGSRARYRDLTHEWAFTDTSLRTALLASGLEPLAIAGERIPAVTAAAWCRGVVAGAFRAVWRVYLVAELGREGLESPLEFNLLAIAERR